MIEWQMMSLIRTVSISTGRNNTAENRLRLAEPNTINQIVVGGRALCACACTTRHEVNDAMTGKCVR